METDMFVMINKKTNVNNIFLYNKCHYFGHGSIGKYPLTKDEQLEWKST